MASGYPVKSLPLSGGRSAVIIDALVAIIAINSGKWFDASKIEKGTFEFFKDGAGTLTSFACQVYGSNSPDCPADSVDGFVIGASNTTVNGSLALATPARWLKVKTTAISVAGDPTGSLGVRLFAFTY